MHALAASPVVMLLANISDKQTWYGDAVVAMHGASEPVLVVTSWVYGPSEIVAVGPVDKTSWTDLNFTKAYKYETVCAHLMAVPVRLYSRDAGECCCAFFFDLHSTSAPSLQLYVDTAGSSLPSNAVDSIAFWNQHPNGPPGKCSLIGFNSHNPPVQQPSTSGEPGWRVDFPNVCTNVNAWVPFSRFDISADGKLAIAWIQDEQGAVHIYGMNGQTGTVLWNVSQSTSPKYQDYFLCYGANIAKNGEWVIYDFGIEGGPGQFSLRVVSAVDGSTRDTVMSPASVQGTISPDGDYVISVDNPDTATFTVNQWNPSTKKYAKLGSVVVDGGSIWILANCAFGQFTPSGAASLKTIVGCGWYSKALDGDIRLAVYDVSNLSAGPIAQYSNPGPSNDKAFDGIEASCAGALCAVAMQTQAAGTAHKPPTLVMFDGTLAAGSKAAPFFNYTTVGTMNGVGVSAGTDATTGQTTYYVGIGGCTTVAGCDTAGAEAFLFQVTGIEGCIGPQNGNCVA